MQKLAPVLAGIALGVGVFMLGLGIAGDPRLRIPGAILVGAAVIAIQRR